MEHSTAAQTAVAPSDGISTALVTGAGTGIGRATARVFAAAGDRVIAVGRRPGPLAEAAEGHDGIIPFSADITAPGEPERIVAAGRLAVLDARIAAQTAVRDRPAAVLRQAAGERADPGGATERTGTARRTGPAGPSHRTEHAETGPAPRCAGPTSRLPGAVGSCRCPEAGSVCQSVLARRTGGDVRGVN
jgi:threonine dehydrogenase-like Zn-dependent dehydrogenase